jgi:hypothetical protein
MSKQPLHIVTSHIDSVGNFHIIDCASFWKAKIPAIVISENLEIK